MDQPRKHDQSNGDRLHREELDDFQSDFSYTGLGLCVSTRFLNVCLLSLAINGKNVEI